MSHTYVLYSSQPIPSILDNNSKCDPVSSFVFARDRPEGLEVILASVHQGVDGRSPRLSPCTASRPNLMLFESLELPCPSRAPAYLTRRFRVIDSIHSEPVLSSAPPYDKVLYPVRVLRQASMTRNSSFWWAVRRRRTFELYLAHVAHPCRIASNASGSSTLSFSDNRGFRQSYN